MTDGDNDYHDVDDDHGVMHADDDNEDDDADEEHDIVAEDDNAADNDDELILIMEKCGKHARSYHLLWQ